MSGTLGRVLGEALKRLRGRFRLGMVLLHGSYAKGTYVEGVSDVDLLVVSDDFEGVPVGRRLSELAELLAGLELPVEAIGLTSRELFEALREFNPLVLDALEYGKLVYGEELYRRALRELEDLKRRYKLRPIKGGWAWTEPREEKRGI